MDLNFPLIMVIAVFVTGLIALVDKLWLKKRRDETGAKEPSVIETSKSIFPVLAVVLVVRSFIFEPFQIPSGSMIPTLAVGDFIVVNKFSYGLRLPVIGTKILPVADPKHGEVVVFKEPGNEHINFIKRVIGVPGDVIRYQNKKLTINGKPLPQEYLTAWGSDTQYIEQHGEHKYTVQTANGFGDLRAEGEWTVPAGHYFVMGDNRDRSNDSRYWGFVPDENIVGKATHIWMHWPSWGTIPNFKNNGAIQ